MMKKQIGDAPACVDCVHYRRGGESDPERCYSDDCSTFDPVRGREPESPSTARNANNGKCGPKGFFFEPLPGPNWLDRNFGRIILLAMIFAFGLWAWRQFS